MTRRYLSLFAGIGGFEIAAQIANDLIGHEAFEPAALCEINPFEQKVLQHHYPHVPLIPDVTRITTDLIRELGAIAGIAGGFPCQDISNAGKGAGLAGERSGLFFEVVRLVRLVRPRFVFLENVAALTRRGLSTVLREFASLGYDAEWSIIPCSDLGGSHQRARIWIIAYPNRDSDFGEIRGCDRSEVRVQGIDWQEDSSTRKLSRANSQSEERRGALQPPPWSFHRAGGIESLVYRCHDGVPFGLGDDSAYLLRLDDLPDWLPFASDSLPIAYRKEALQAYGNAIVPQVGAIGFLKIYQLLQDIGA